MSDYAEGALHGWRRIRVSRHLARCDLCGAAYRSFLATLAGLRLLSRREPPARPELADEVVERVRRREAD